MIAGAIYRPLDAELTAERRRARLLCAEHGTTVPMIDPYRVIKKIGL